MLHLGIDIGTSTVKLALINASDVCAVWGNAHKNNISQTISDGLNNIITQCTQSIPSFNEQMELSVGLTGADALSLHTALDLPNLCCEYQSTLICWWKMYSMWKIESVGAIRLSLCFGQLFMSLSTTTKKMPHSY